MKRTIELADWSLIQVEPRSDGCRAPADYIHGERIPMGKPVTALEALINAGRVPGSILEDGEAAYCEWVAEKDWLYICTFPRPETGGRVFLHFLGLDTDCEIYLGGEKIAEHHTMYLPLRMEVTGRLKPENELAVYFHSPHKVFRHHAQTMPEEWKDAMSPAALMRKAPCDLFRNYLGVTPYFAPVGFFGDVLIELPGAGELRETNCTYRLRPDRAGAEVCFSAAASVDGGAAEIEFALLDPDGVTVFRARVPVGPDDGATAGFTLEKPRLWWPVGYGERPLYRAMVTLIVGDMACDTCVKQIGFRSAELVGDLLFRINGRVIRLWGSNIATPGSITHRSDPGRMRFLLDKAEACHCNTLRIWGPGELVCDEFYDEADRRGILIWQDFPVEPSQMPDTQEFRALLVAEAECLVRRLRSHPCLLLWCGGNESLHMNDFRNETARIGVEDLLLQIFPALCARLDPGRHYHASCPALGLYPNDPLTGDTHGSHCMMSYMPGEEYAVFFSEHIVTTPPELRSLARFVPERDIWPEGYQDLAAFGRKSCFPPALERRTMGTTQAKLGPIERFYDATDAESLVYKFAAAAGYAYYHQISRLRRGKPVSDAAGPRRVNGYMGWKFNNTWPAFYCGLVDYYGQSHIPYYETRRAFEPLLLTLDVGDHIHVWAVNDTPEDLQAILTVKVFRMSENRVIHEFSCPASVLAGESAVLANLDRLRYFRRDCVVYACLERDGVQIARATEFVDLERNLPFPQATLTLSVAGDRLTVRTDAFARCVELSGRSEECDAFGWHFEDNYFDLLPFEQRTVRITGRHSAGILSAKAHYAHHSAEIAWNAEG
jgi:hypothetical protein